MKPSPQVPPGTSSLLSGATDNLSFHSSPESFLASQVLKHHKDHPEAVNKRQAVRAKILNRNVIILSSYHHIQQVLDPANGYNGDQPAFVATSAYDQLMSPFFPPSNLLLNDGPSHQHMKNTWQPCSHALASLASSDALSTLIREHLTSLPLSQPVDLYEMLKSLTWEVYLAVFLDLSPSDRQFETIVKDQEDLLRGQFSLLPVNVKVPGVWHSPRNKGISARKNLQRVIEEVIAIKRPAWLASMSKSSISAEEIVNHALMATSSLAVKATASFLFAFLLNMFVYRPPQVEARSWANAAEISTVDERQRRIEAVVQETLRLSPPIVGVMRRATVETVLQTADDEEPDVLIPKDWDVWCYFPGANREAATYGIAGDQELLRPIRFHAQIRPSHQLPLPFAFGAGGKSCLGEPFVRQLAATLYEAFAAAGLEVQGSVEEAGVKGWLGWGEATPEQWAQGMKQLPTQRPSEPVMVRLEKSQVVYWKEGGELEITKLPRKTV